MKRSLFAILTAMVAINLVAANRFYLPDFAIAPGETMQVAMVLENDEQFTAFQTDLLLPDGLSVVEDDGEFLLDLTGRNPSDQTIISKLRDDGALRMVSFCMSVRPYSGNKGPIVVINLHADESFTGPATIGLKFTFFATVDGTEITLPEESCNVQLLAQQLKGDANGDGLVNISDVTAIINYLLSGCISSFHTENADMNDDNNVNITDATMLINAIMQV